MSTRMIRPFLMRRVQGKRLLHQAGVALLLLIAAVDRVVAHDADFRILFAPGANVPITDAVPGDHNRRAFEKTAHVMRTLVPLGDVRFIFVARRTSVCQANASCDPAYLMWQRVNATTAAIRLLASQQREDLPFRLIGWSFLEELAAGTDLAPEQPEFAAIDLKLHVDLAHVASTCPWRVLIYDPELPSIIGAPPMAPALPILAGQKIVVGAGTTVAIERAGKAKEMPAAAWEDARGEFRRADIRLLSGTASPVPDGAIKLHIFDPALPRVDQFVSELKDDFGIPAATPEFLNHRIARGLARGFEDNAGPVPRQVLPTQESVSHCAVGIERAATPNARSDAAQGAHQP